MMVPFWVTDLFGEWFLVSETTRLGLPPHTNTSTDVADAQLLFLLVYSRDPLQSPTYKSIESY